MKKNLKLLISSVFTILIFVPLQVTQCMEDFSNVVRNKINSYVHIPLTSFTDGERILENPFNKCPEEIKLNILEHAAIDNYFSDGTIGNLKSVCQDWRRIIKQDRIKIKKSIELAIYQKFLKGVLLYKPNPKSNRGKVEIPIAALENPLDGTFDLSQCGSSSKYLIISTGYSIRNKVEDEGKVKIWLIPRFLMGHFNEIDYNPWKEGVEVGLFWEWIDKNGLEKSAYLTTENMDNLSKNNLCENWWKASDSDEFSALFSGYVGSNYDRRCEGIEKFYIHFNASTPDKSKPLLPIKGKPVGEHSLRRKACKF